MSLENEKTVLRRSFLSMRKALSSESVEARSYKIQKKLKALSHLAKAKSVLFYVPINHEVDLLSLAKKCREAGKTVLFPRVLENRIRPAEVVDFTRDFARGAFNIPEPTGKLFSGTIDLVLVPGVVFGKNFQRIGYGKGFYDSFLNSGQCRYSIGVGYDFQLVSAVPSFEHDVELDAIITENESLENQDH